MTENRLNPLNDGITHINVYSKASTELGRLLSNFAYTPFVHPIFGKFDSVEGFWYWLGTGCIHDKLRSLHGYSAKQYGKTLEIIHRDDFEDNVKLAILTKIESSEKLSNMLVKSKLPLVHYYYFGEKDNAKIVEPTSHRWIIDFITDVRTELKMEIVPSN